MSRVGRFLGMAAAAALLAAGPASGQSAPPSRGATSERDEIAKTMREVRRKLRLSPIVLVNDRLVEGETLYVAADLVNRDVEELVLGPHMRRREWRVGNAQWWLERVDGGAQIPMFDRVGTAARRGRQYATGGSVIQLGETAGANVVVIGPGEGTKKLMRPVLETGGAGLWPGSYELTVEITDLETRELIEVRKARFTVLPR